MNNDDAYGNSYKQFGSAQAASEAFIGGGAIVAPDTKEQWFADYQNPNSDPQDLQERARDLGIDGKDWQAYHERRAEAAKQF